VKALYAECNRFVLPPLENMEVALALNGSTKWPLKSQIFHGGKFLTSQVEKG